MTLADFADRIETYAGSFLDTKDINPLIALLHGLADEAKAEHDRQTTPPVAFAFRDVTDGELEQLRGLMAKLARESSPKVEITPIEPPALPDPDRPGRIETLQAERRYRVVRVPGEEIRRHTTNEDRRDPDFSWLFLCPTMDSLPAGVLFVRVEEVGSYIDPRDDYALVTAYHESFEPVAKPAPQPTPSWSSLLFC